MAIYSVQVSHARYWRGKPHRWSTRYTYSGPAGVVVSVADLQAFAEQESKLLASSRTGGSTVGGWNHVAFYNKTTGGTALTQFTHFDWTTPASWIRGASGSAWAATAAQDPIAENALVIHRPAGLSVKGKPVVYRNFYHDVPASFSVGPGQDITTADLATLKTAAEVLPGFFYGTYGIINGNGVRVPGSAVVEPFYRNHQMPRGRRRKTAAKTAQDNGILQDTINALLKQTSSQAGLA